jgi:hypothetical protein
MQFHAVDERKGEFAGQVTAILSDSFVPANSPLPARD